MSLSPSFIDEDVTISPVPQVKVHIIILELPLTTIFITINLSTNLSITLNIYFPTKKSNILLNTILLNYILLDQIKSKLIFGDNFDNAFD